MHTWTSKCLLGDPLDPWITKMVSQVPKMESQGLQNISFWCKSDPFHWLSCHQLPVAKGPAAGGEALKYIYIYIYIYGITEKMK